MAVPAGLTLTPRGLQDVNSGYRLDSDGLVNIYTRTPADARVKYSSREYNVYSEVFSQIRETIVHGFELEELWFTAPTFITRTTGNTSWSAKN